jgi:hypothetical protein
MNSVISSKLTAVACRGGVVSHSGAWRTLAAGENPQGVVLAVDFDVTGRVEARFSDLMPNLGIGDTIWETIPPPVRTERAWTGSEYVDHWARAALQTDLPVRALLGFCAGSVYAAALAERISQVQAPPLLVLFDPELSVPQTLLWQFFKIVGFMSGTIPAAEATALREAGQRAYDECAQVGELQAALSGLLRERGEVAFAQAGLDRRLRGELLDIIDSCLCYLAAASQLDPLDQWKSAVAIGSSSPMSGLRGMRRAGTEVTVAREIDVAADHATMLGDAEVAAVVRSLLAP